MKKTVVVASMLALLVSACSQIPGFAPTPTSGPAVDAAAGTSVFETAVVQTLTAQAPTLAPATETPTLPVLELSPTGPALTDTPPALATFTAIPTFTSLPDLTTTPATATSGAASTATPGAVGTATLSPAQLTASPTLGIRTYGTLPPEVPFNRITLSNRSKAEAYISLQVTMNDGKFSILEYPVEGTFKIKAPVGSYLYVAWVGGRKMVGTFHLSQSNEISITLYKDRVVIK